MRIALVTLAVGAVLLAWAEADTRPPSRPQHAPVTVVDEGPAARALMKKYECARCHEGTGLAAPPRERQCVGCHQEILSGKFPAPPALLAEWQQHVRSLTVAPDLTGVGTRLRRRWVEAHLLEPVDARPSLPATMPRLSITPEEASLMARVLVPAEATGAVGGDVAAGARLYGELGCASCHAYSGVTGGAPKLDARQPQPAILLAPDLALTRERMQPARVAAWIRHAPGTLMPAYPITDPQAQDLAAFVLRAPIAPAPLRGGPLPSRLPVLDRKVGYAEVERRVLRKVCWHCHSSPDYARGDGGPGNTGGFGFAPRGVDLSSYAGVASGRIGDDGERHSLFLPEPSVGGIPRFVALLVARHAEVAGRPVAGLRGMPLGFPPLSYEEIQLVESWIAQGRPR